MDGIVPRAALPDSTTRRYMKVGCDMAGWIEKFRALPTPLLMAHVAAKFVGGVGIGMLIAAYAGGDWVAAGWVLIALSFVIAIPSSKRILFK